MPLIDALSGGALGDEHWAEVLELVDLPGRDAGDVSFEALLHAGARGRMAEIMEVTAAARGEFELGELLATLRGVWASATLSVVPLSEDATMSVLGACEDITAALDAHQVLLQQMVSSSFVTSVWAEVVEWEALLSRLADVLDEWLALQRSWLHLERLFATGVMQRELPLLAARFSRVDRFFRELMRRTEEHPLAIAAAKKAPLLDALLDSNRVLAEVMAALDDYLETKRQAFPRFYFLSNDGLLEMLRRPDPRSASLQLAGCFGGVSRRVASVI